MMKVRKEISFFTSLIRHGITAASHPQLYEDFQTMLKSADIKHKVRLVPYLDEIFNGQAYSRGRILITTALLQEYEKSPNVTRCMLAHEIAHLRYGDLGFKILRDNIRAGFGKNLSRAVTLLREMRAEFLAPAIAGLPLD